MADSRVTAPQANPITVRPFPLHMLIGDISQDINDCSYNEEDVREMWNNGTLNEAIAARLKEYPWQFEHWTREDGDYDSLVTYLVKMTGGWHKDWGTAVSPLTAKEIGKIVLFNKKVALDWTNGAHSECVLSPSNPEWISGAIEATRVAAWLVEPRIARMGHGHMHIAQVNKECIVNGQKVMATVFYLKLTDVPAAVVPKEIEEGYTNRCIVIPHNSFPTKDSPSYPVLLVSDWSEDDGTYFESVMHNVPLDSIRNPELGMAAHDTQVFNIMYKYLVTGLNDGEFEKVWFSTI